MLYSLSFNSQGSPTTRAFAFAVSTANALRHRSSNPVRSSSTSTDWLL